MPPSPLKKPSASKPLTSPKVSTKPMHKAVSEGRTQVQQMLNLIEQARQLRAAVQTTLKSEQVTSPPENPKNPKRAWAVDISHRAASIDAAWIAHETTLDALVDQHAKKFKAAIKQV